MKTHAAGGLRTTRLVPMLLTSLALVAVSCSSSDSADPSGGKAGAGADGGVSWLDGSPDSAKDGAGCGSKTCAQLGASCGKAPDGCGGVVSCGDCPSGSTCGAGGPNKCGNGSCNPKTCAQLGASCGSLSDGCSSTLDCGDCTPPMTCGGAGVDFQCGGAASDGGCVAAPEVCNGLDDNCDGVIDNVGDVGTVCAAALPSAGHVNSWSCDKGACAIASCEPGRRNCDGSSTNGCESNDTKWRCPLSNQTFGDAGSCNAACNETAACSESCSTTQEYYRVNSGYSSPCECAPGDPGDCEQKMCFSGTCDYSGSTLVGSPPAGSVHIGTGCSGYLEGAEYYRLDIQNCSYTCPFGTQCDGSPPKQCSHSANCNAEPTC